MAIQMRRGYFADFDASKMVAGEFAVCLDNGYVYVTLSPGNVVRLGTADTIEEALSQAMAFRNQAEASATNASASATTATNASNASKINKETSEAWAVGKRDGANVPSSDPAYNNNSRYYCEQAKHFSENATYVFIRYSANADGTNFVATPTSSTVYMGVYTGNSSTAPTNKSLYNWVRFIGRDGSGTNSISTLTDVALGVLTDGQTLVYDSATQKWVNGFKKATKSSIGGIIVGDNLEIDENGVLSADAGMRPATDKILGGIIVGNNLEINAEGKLDATNTTYNVATTDVAGLMSATDKAKLNGIAEGATANLGTITSVNGSTPISATTSTGGAVTVNHSTSGVSNNYYGDGGSSRTLSSGSSFTIPYYYVNNTGHITYATNKTMYMPNLDVSTASRDTLGGIKICSLTMGATKSISISAHSNKIIYFQDHTTSSAVNVDVYSPKYYVERFGRDYNGCFFTPRYEYPSLIFSYDPDVYPTRAKLYNASASTVTISASGTDWIGDITILYT